MFDNTLGQMLTYESNPGGCSITGIAALGITSGTDRQVFFVLQPDADAQVYVSLGVDAITPNSTAFLLHLYTVDANNTLSTQLAEFNTITTSSTAGIGYVSFDMRGYTLAGGQTYVVFIAPTSGKYLTKFSSTGAAVPTVPCFHRPTSTA